MRCVFANSRVYARIAHVDRAIALTARRAPAPLPPYGYAADKLTEQDRPNSLDDADIAADFPDASHVNDALRELLRLRKIGRT